MSNAHSDGLDGVVVAETKISGIDGELGRLWVRGQDVETLAREQSFEAFLGLLLDDALPDETGVARWRCALGAARLRAFDGLWRMGAALEAEDGMDALRAAAACLEEDSPNSRSTDDICTPNANCARTIVAARNPSSASCKAAALEVICWDP